MLTSVFDTKLTLTLRMIAFWLRMKIVLTSVFDANLRLTLLTHDLILVENENRVDISI